MQGLRAREASVLEPLVVVLLLVGLVGCGGGTGPSDREPPDDPPGTPPPATPPDLTTPLVGGWLRTYDDSAVVAIGTNVYLPQDSVFFDVVAEDNHLTWIGLDITGAFSLRDSVDVPRDLGPAVLLPVTLIRPGAVGSLTIRGFARDSAGHLATAVLEGNPAHLVAPESLIYPQDWGGAADLAIDLLGYAGRHRTFWVAGDSIGRDDGTGYIGPGIPAPGQSVDILMDPDRLIVTLPSLGAYGIVGLTFVNEDYPPVEVIADTVTEVPGVPWALRTAANGHVIVHRQHPTDPALDSWVDLDPGTGEQRLLPAVSVRRGRVDRTIDHARVVAWDTLCCDGLAQVYTAATAEWSAPVAIGATGLQPVTMDTLGIRLLAGTQLYALPELTPLERFRPPHLAGGTVLSPDGQSLIAVTSAGFLRVWRDNLAADLTALGQHWPEPFFHAPNLPDLVIPVRSEPTWFRASVRLPPTTHTVTASLRARAPAGARPARLTRPGAPPLPRLPPRTVTLP